MWLTIKWIGGTLAVLTVIFLLSWYGLGMQKFFAPRVANIEREVFEQTQSHVHGMVQQLAKHKLEYDQGDAATKVIIKNTIVTQFAHFDESKIKAAGLRNFLIEQRGF